MKKIIEKELGNIEIPKELNKISEKGIKKASLEMRRRNNINKYIKRVSAVAATFILAITLITTSNSTLANSLKGFFKDITNRNGAITGTIYDESTEEIDIEISNVIKDNELSVQLEVTFKDTNKAPYSSIEVLTLGDFKIVDSLGNKINFKINNEDKLLVEVNNENKSIRSFSGNLIINNDSLNPNEKYTLIINSFYGHKKADAPIEIKGNWKVDLSS